MTTQFGRPVAIVLALLCILAGGPALAAVDATVDRQQIALGDTLQLVISATEEDEDLGSVRLEELHRDWEVISRSTRSNTSIINGKRSHNRQLNVELTPLREGVLKIPPFQVGARQTRPLLIQVAEAPELDPGSAAILFEATVDADTVYVQGQLILTLRLQQAVNLDGRSISDLELPGAFVVPLEQKSFQRRIDGKPWLVHEVRYAIFPEQSGTLTIPAQRFSARESIPRRSLFDNTRGRVVRLNSDPIAIEVLPRPAQFNGNTWLPARNIVVEEEWSGDPENLQAGESVTRTIRLRGEGLQGAQLPPVLLGATEGIKHYPDQPTITDAEISSGLLGSRSDSVAIVPTRAGEVVLPATEIPWWDTQAQVMRKAIVPSRTLQVAPAPAAGQTPDLAAGGLPGVANSASAAGGSSPGYWPLATLVCALGWLLTALLWWRGRQPVISDTGTGKPATDGRGAYKSLLAACAADQPEQARKHFIHWAAAVCEQPAITTLAEAGAALADDELSSELALLEETLYSTRHGRWQGAALRACVERLQKQAKKTPGAETDGISLYPAG